MPSSSARSRPSLSAAPLTRKVRRRFLDRCAAAAPTDTAVSTAPVSTRLSIRPAAATGRRYLRFDRSFAHGLGHEVLVHNLGVRLAHALNLTLVYEPLLASAERGDHAELKGMAGALEAVIGVGRGEARQRRRRGGVHLAPRGPGRGGEEHDEHFCLA